MTTIFESEFFFGGKSNREMPRKTKVNLQSGMDKQKKSADFRFHGSKFGPVFILKVVHSLAFDIMYFNKSSFIFPMN